MDHLRDRLVQSVVRIDHEGNVGTGFFIDSDGSILTCFHVIRDKKTLQATKREVAIWFDGQEYVARCIAASTDPDLLDAAILRLNDEEMPSKAVLLPLGRWQEAVPAVRSFGFCHPRTVNGLHARSMIQGRTRTDRNQVFLHFSPQAAQQMRPGMSGAPLYCEEANQIVGVIAHRFRADGVKITCAIPIEEIAEIHPRIKERLAEEKVLQNLQQILVPGKWFTENTLRRFYESLSFPNLPAYDELEANRPQGIVDQLRSRSESVYDFIKALQLRHPTIPLDDVLPEGSLGFVNRDEELRETTGSLAVPYIFFEAPAGYGKTALLSAIRQRDIAHGWLCIYVDAPPTIDSALSLARFVAQQADCQIPARLRHVQNVAWMLAGHLQQRLSVAKKDRSAAKKGLTLIIDSVEQLPDVEIDDFLNQFLAELLEALPKINIRLRLAGRYIGGRWSQKAQTFNLPVLALSPFQFHYVRETVRTRFPKHKHLDSFAAHLMHITGGHPRCMKQIMDACDSTRSPEDHFEAEATRYRQMVLKVVNNIRELIPSDLRHVFDVLSVFRRYTYAILNSVLEAGLIPYTDGNRRLEKDLLATYLVKREEAFIQDEIVRRLLALRLRWEEPDTFARVINEARKIHRFYLERTTYPEAIFIEALYQELVTGYYRSDMKAAARHQLSERFFTDGGILERYLEKLEEKPELDSIGASLVNILENEKDWEFAFSVKFFLREEEYTDAPYNTLCQRVKRFFR